MPAIMYILQMYTFCTYSKQYYVVNLLVFVLFQNMNAIYVFGYTGILLQDNCCFCIERGIITVENKWYYEAIIPNFTVTCMILYIFFPST